MEVKKRIAYFAGTECHVFESRNKDTNTDGLLRWTFTIASFWGETPKGKFVIDIYDKVIAF